jgi:hypothetical protein
MLDGWVMVPCLHCPYPPQFHSCDIYLGVILKFSLNKGEDDLLYIVLILLFI